MTIIRILFVGESWLGSCARSLKEALARQPGVLLDEVNEDLWIPKARARVLRAAHRLLNPAYKMELMRQVMSRVDQFRPDTVLLYKGHSIGAERIQEIRARGVLTVNVYPDCSPHTHGSEHKAAVGSYDLVVSTKPFHPTLWKSVYGYANRCVFVPQGYDQLLHLQHEPAREAKFDVTLVATWRPEYGALMQRFGEAPGIEKLNVAIAGNGWAAHRADYPKAWIFGGERQGRSYLEWLRQGKIAIAPVTREVVIGGRRQPGDEDSTRTYELAAANCFFIHRRTKYVQSLYNEATEVPMFDTPEELAEKVIYHLDRPELRERMLTAAHARAVPAYSLDAQAEKIVSILAKTLGQRNGGAAS